MKIGYFTILFSHPWQKGAAMYSETLLQEVFEPGYVPSLIYSAKQAYGKQRHCSRTRFLRISDNENENFIGKSRKEFLAPLTRTDDP